MQKKEPTRELQVQLQEVNFWVGDQSVHDRQHCLDAEAVWGELLCSWEDGSGANRVESGLLPIDLVCG